MPDAWFGISVENKPSIETHFSLAVRPAWRSDERTIRPHLERNLSRASLALSEYTCTCMSLCFCLSVYVPPVSLSCKLTSSSFLSSGHLPLSGYLRGLLGTHERFVDVGGLSSWYSCVLRHIMVVLFDGSVDLESKTIVAFIFEDDDDDVASLELLVASHKRKSVDPMSRTD